MPRPPHSAGPGGLHRLSPCPLQPCRPRGASTTLFFMTTEVSRKFRPSSRMPLAVEGWGGWQLCHEAWRPLRPWPSQPGPPWSWERHGHQGGSSGPGRPARSSRPLALDKHSDPRRSREHQPLHQERLDLLGVRSHKSRGSRLIACRSGTDHGGRRPLSHAPLPPLIKWKMSQRPSRPGGARAGTSGKEGTCWSSGPGQGGHS